MSEFLTELEVTLLGDNIWRLDADLVYNSTRFGIITAPAGLQMDFCSVPRIPLVFDFFGDTCHREGVIHDYLYRIDAVPKLVRSQADYAFLEAMKCRGKLCAYPMYLGVRIGGWTAWHKRKIGDKLS